MTENEVKNQPLDSEAGKNTGFTIKITNLRKDAYSTNFPTESDYFGFKVGDYLIKGSSNTIYEVQSIIRQPIDNTLHGKYFKYLTRYGKITDKRANDLLEEYQKNGNFGLNNITIKPVLRGEKLIAKGRIKSFLELDNISCITYRGYKRTDLIQAIGLKDHVIANLKYRVSIYQGRVDNQIKLKQGLQDLLDSKNPAILVPYMQPATPEANDLMMTEWMNIEEKAAA